MFESMEIRKAENGIIVTIKTEDEDKDFVFPNIPKTLKFVKEYLDAKEIIAQGFRHHSIQGLLRRF